MDRSHGVGLRLQLGFNGSLLMDNKFLCPLNTNVMTAACQDLLEISSWEGCSVLFCSVFLRWQKHRLGGGVGGG
jgi:hypothetical protein